MSNSYLNLLGLSRRAGLLESGDEASRGAVSRGAARLLILASDASERTCESFAFIAESAGIPHIAVAENREEIGNAIGKRPTAVVALCDNGFSAAVLEKLADSNEDARALLPVFRRKAERSSRRRKAAKKQ